MPLFLRVYYNAVFGGLGGLIAWMVLGVLGVRIMETTGEFLLNGALIGCAIGYLVVSVEAIRDRSLVRFSYHASYGLVLGAIGGAIGMLVGEWVNAGIAGWVGADREGSFFYVLGTMLARGLGWMFLGVAVGMSEGVISRSMGKFSYGAFGGLIGGFVGGALFNLFHVIARRQGASSLLAGAIGLVILGACIGALSALVKAVFQPASVKVLRGWQEGREYPLDKLATLVGRDEHADIALFRDMRIEKQHAFIKREGNRFILVNNNAPPDYTRVNGAPVSQFRDLQDGDRIELGRVVLRFQLRQAQEKQRKSPPFAIPVPAPTQTSNPPA